MRDCIADASSGAVIRETKSFRELSLFEVMSEMCICMLQFVITPGMLSSWFAVESVSRVRRRFLSRSDSSSIMSFNCRIFRRSSAPRQEVCRRKAIIWYRSSSNACSTRCTLILLLWSNGYPSSLLSYRVAPTVVIVVVRWIACMSIGVAYPVMWWGEDMLQTLVTCPINENGLGLHIPSSITY